MYVFPLICESSFCVPLIDSSSLFTYFLPTNKFSHGGYDYDGDGKGDHPQSFMWESADAPLLMTFDHSIQDITPIPLEGEQNSDTPGVMVCERK